MARIVNEFGTGFEVKLTGHELNIADSPWIAFTLAILKGNTPIFQTMPEERRSIEIDELERFIENLKNSSKSGSSLEFEPMEPEFHYVQVSHGDDFDLSFSIDIDRTFEGIRSFEGNLLTITLGISEKQIQSFAEELSTELSKIK